MKFHERQRLPRAEIDHADALREGVHLHLDGDSPDVLAHGTRGGEGIPSRTCLEANAHALARFAALSQESGLVPIVEPEVLMDGEHTIERHFEVTEAAQRAVFHALAGHRVRLEAMLLKPNMVLPGKECPQQASAPQVAEMTLRCLRQAVPAAVPGIAFLSGGQSDVLATAHLNALNQLGKTPWQLSFSFGRALQAPALEAWAGNPENVAAAQKALHHRAGCNGAARHGKYSPEAEAHGTGGGPLCPAMKPKD